MLLTLKVGYIWRHHHAIVSDPNLVLDLVQIEKTVSSAKLQPGNSRDCLDQISRLILSGCIPQVPKQPISNSSRIEA